MKKLPFLVAAGVLGLSGCAATKYPGNVTDYLNEVEVARRDRADAPTVYNGEAMAAPGHTVTTDDGILWAPEMKPGNTVTNTASDILLAYQNQDSYVEVVEPKASSEVIDLGPTASLPQE